MTTTPSAVAPIRSGRPPRDGAGPGPWPIHAFAADGRPLTLRAAVDDGPPALLGTATDPEGGVWALLPPPRRAALAYRAQAGGEQPPADAPARQVTVLPSRRPPSRRRRRRAAGLPLPPGGVHIRARRHEGRRRAAGHGAAGGDAAGGHPRPAGTRSPALASAAGGLVRFEGVEVPAGRLLLTASADAAGGFACRASVTVRR
ncbi:MAG: hypothetical protein R3F43_13260 [bacterium]